MSEQMPDEMEMLQMAQEKADRLLDEIRQAHALFDEAGIEHSGQTMVDRVRLALQAREDALEVAKQKVIRNRKLEAIAESAVRYGSFSKHFKYMLCGSYWKPENTPSHRIGCPIADLENA